jgi:hypothetical protein
LESRSDGFSEYRMSSLGQHSFTPSLQFFLLAVLRRCFVMRIIVVGAMVIGSIASVTATGVGRINAIRGTGIGRIDTVRAAGIGWVGAIRGTGIGRIDGIRGTVPGIRSTERVSGISRELPPYLGVIVQKILQIIVVMQVSRVVRKRWIALQIRSDSRMLA